MAHEAEPPDSPPEERLPKCPSCAEPMTRIDGETFHCEECSERVVIE